MTYLAALSDRNLWELRRIIRRGFQAADLNGWEVTANECAMILLDTWEEIEKRHPVYKGYQT